MFHNAAQYIASFAALAVVALGILSVRLLRMLRRLQRGQQAVLGPHGRRDLVRHVQMLEEQVANLRDAEIMLTDAVESYRSDLDGSLRNLALVRFDAFREAGGQQSAAIAILDNYRSGVVISIIASREVSRLYVKHVEHGRADRDLSPEEGEAMRRAVPNPLQPGQLSGARIPTLPRTPLGWGVPEDDVPAVLPGQEALDLSGLPDASDERHPWRSVENRSVEAFADDLASSEHVADDELERADSVIAEPAAAAAATAEPSSRPRRQRNQDGADDWLGGDDLDF